MSKDNDEEEMVRLRATAGSSAYGRLEVRMVRVRGYSKVWCRRDGSIGMEGHQIAVEMDRLMALNVLGGWL